jgi:hypothetical protein
MIKKSMKTILLFSIVDLVISNVISSNLILDLDC